MKAVGSSQTYDIWITDELGNELGRTTIPASVFSSPPTDDAEFGVIANMDNTAIVDVVITRSGAGAWVNISSQQSGYQDRCRPKTPLGVLVWDDTVRFLPGRLSFTATWKR
jgi:hypothetical protein